MSQSLGSEVDNLEIESNLPQDVIVTARDGT